MSQQQQQQQQQQQKAYSQYPLPPRRYYQNFSSTPTPAPPPPPPPGEKQSYFMFGREYTTDDTLPTLEASGRKRLYDPDVPPCRELSRLNNLLLSNFLDLVNSLCEPLPADSADNPHLDVISNIEDIFVNMQHLINTMRPMQAASDIRTLLDRQTKQRKDTTESLQEAHRKAWELIKQAARRLDEPSVNVNDSDIVMSTEPLNDLPSVKTKSANVPDADTLLRVANIVSRAF